MPQILKNKHKITIGVLTNQENYKLNVHLFYVPLKLDTFLSGDQICIQSPLLASRSMIY